MPKSDLVGRCGLYCGACDIYRVYVDKRIEKQKKMAAFFKCKPEQVRCQGCQNLTSQDWCYNCKIIKCLEQHGYTYCYECKKIETCAIYQELNRRYNNYAYGNVMRLKEVGEKIWLKEMAKRWTCPHCETPLTLDETTCPTCGCELTTKKI